MKKYVCKICGYIYDEANEKVKFDDLPDDWKCPLCGAPKSMFQLLEEESENIKEKNIENNPVVEEDMREMTYGELSALCSNLSRGCEKQYLSRESELFKKLSDYYDKKSKEKNEDNYNIDALIDKINNDLETNYKKAREISEKEKDRGALRIITWGEKVTLILKPLLTSYQSKGEDSFKDKKIYVCDICGFIYVGNEVPSICPICKVPSFKILEIGKEVR